MYYPGGTNVITYVLKRELISGYSQRKKCDHTRKVRGYSAASIEDVRWTPQAKECRLPVETGKHKETNCTLESPERNTKLLTF